MTLSPKDVFKQTIIFDTKEATNKVYIILLHVKSKYLRALNFKHFSQDTIYVLVACGKNCCTDKTAK